LGQDIIWETRVRYVPPPYFWFALWCDGNKWNQGAEFDVVESYGYYHTNMQGQYVNNFNGALWHSSAVGAGTNNQVSYSNWGAGMQSRGITNYDATQYHTWTMYYGKDNSYAFYVDGTKVQYGSGYYWTRGHVLGDPVTNSPINMSFLFDATWGSRTLYDVNYSMPASALAGTYYEWDYSRVYLR
jgi:hypothetical protein